MKGETLLILVGVGAAAFVIYKAVPKVAQAAQAVNPLNPNNVFYSGANQVTQQVTGDQGTTFGSWLYQLFNPGAVAAEQQAVYGSSAPAVTDQSSTDATTAAAFDMTGAGVF